MAARALRTFTPLRVEGTVRHQEGEAGWEYSVLLSIKDAKGTEVTRQVMGVGALAPGEERTFSLVVEVFAPERYTSGA